MDTPNIICTDRDWMEAARRFRREIIYAPVNDVMAKLAEIATLRDNVVYEEKQYEIDADMEFGNYDPTRTANLDLTVKPRTLKTYFASARKEFDPNQYVYTALSSLTTKGEGLKSVEAARLALNIASKKLGHNLAPYIFSNVRDDASTGSRGLYDGYDTIANNEISAGAVSAENGNLFKITEDINSTNAVDVLKEYCRSANDFLLDKQNINLLLPYSVYYAYLDDYKATTGAIPYNREFKQYYVEGFENIRLKPMGAKKGSNIMQLTTKDNMLVGVGRKGDEGSLIVEKHDVVMLTFFATMFFGLDYLSINRDRIHFAKKFAVATPTITQSSNSITVACATSGATIQYSIDGGAWNAYSAAITATAATQGKVLLARAVKDGETSDVAAHTISYTA